MDRLQLTAVYCNRRGCKHNTSNDPFSRCKCAVNGYRKELTITTYSLTTSAQLDLICFRGDVARRCTTDTNDDMTTMTVFHTEHINTNTRVCLVLFILCQRIVTLHTAPHGSSPSCVRHSSHPHALMMCAVLPRN